MEDLEIKVTGGMESNVEVLRFGDRENYTIDFVTPSWFCRDNEDWAVFESLK